MSDTIKEHYIKNHNTMVKRFTQRAGGVHQAEDIIQTGYERALKYINTFDGLDIDKWINQICFNAWKDFLKAERGNQRSDQEIDDSITEPVNCNSYNSEFAKTMYAEMAMLSEEHNEVLRLYYVHEYLPADISEVTGYKRKNVYLIIERFRNAIKERHA